ncbi:hypothetical protein CWC31_07215 [Pseudoalteromonas ruthenica]|uniref:P-loop NTPase fold protein n=1 Tax=Pseudoalteromonas ruthenica TaxID=151081 RepID=UPI001108B149|nr:P-loop NTPase fold protein [Pseudoalteromonas ruthenica]TLX51394.1 hypothetical protein CWC31_07215 [Pseudoalteromonas ruthenica]
MSQEYQFLLEKPASEDAYKSGSHMRIANSILDTLRNNDSVNVIGIEGDLGSGKSTVINLIEKRCTPDTFELVFFDVEKYQHGATKKALIETIYSQLSKDLEGGPLSRVTKAKNIALGNHLEYEVEVGSHISGWVIAFATSLLFSANLVDEALKGIDGFVSYILALCGWTSKPTSNFQFDLLALCSILITLSPVAIYLMASHQIPFFGRKPPKPGNLLKRNGKDKVAETFEINREVGAYELQEALKEFIQHIPPEKRYILIIDNIDRVTDDKLREVWSDIDVFSAIAHDKIKVLIPYSHKHVAKALCDNDDSGEDDGREFISKRLPVTFRVSPIISADWKSHFERMLCEAIEGVKPYERAAITKLIALLASPTKQITPRYLKCLINSVVSTLLIKLEGVNVVSAFFYQLTIIEGRLNIEEVLRKELDLDRDMSKLAGNFSKSPAIVEQVLSFEDWTKDIVAIHYQAPYEIAESELLTKPLQAALEDQRPEPFINKIGIFGYNGIVYDLLSEHSWESGVALAASILQSSDKVRASNWLHEWLPHINYLHQTNESELKNIQECVSNAEELIAEGYELDMAHFQNKYTNLNTGSPDQSTIDDLYALSKILKETPTIIKSVSADLFDNILWPRRDDFLYWNINSIKLSENLVHELIDSYSEDLLPKDLTQHLLESYKLGWRNQSRTLPSVDTGEIDFEDFDSVEKLLPMVVTEQWKDEENFEFYRSQALNSSDKNISIAWYIQAASVAIATGRPEFTENIPDDIEISGPFEDLLTNTLAFHCSSIELLKALRISSSSYYAGKVLKNLITERRVNSIPVSLTISYFNILAEHTNLTHRDLLKWLLPWKESVKVEAKHIEKLSSEFISKVFEDSEQVEWQNHLKDVLCDESADITWWKQQIIEPSANVTTIVEWYHKHNKTIKKPKALCEAIKETFNEEYETDLEAFDNKSWLDTLLAVIRSSSLSHVINNLNKKMNEYRTSLDLQCAIYRLFHGKVKIESPDIAIAIFEREPDGFDDEELNFEDWTPQDLEAFVNHMLNYEESGKQFPRLIAHNSIIETRAKLLANEEKLEQIESEGKIGA